MKDNEKIYLVPKVKKSTYTYIEGENKQNINTWDIDSFYSQMLKDNNM